MAAAAIPLIISGISALSGLFGGRKKETTQTTDQTTTPQFSQQQNALMQALYGMFMGRTNDTEDWMSSYKSAGMEGINTAAAARSRAIQNILRSRGLSRSPAAASATGSDETFRIGQQSQFLNTLPQVQDQLQRQRLTDLLSYFSAIPTASRTQGTGTTTQPSNMSGGFINGLGQGIAAGYGQQYGLDQYFKSRNKYGQGSTPSSGPVSV